MSARVELLLVGLEGSSGLRSLAGEGRPVAEAASTKRRVGGYRWLRRRSRRLPGAGAGRYHLQEDRALLEQGLAERAAEAAGVQCRVGGRDRLGVGQGGGVEQPGEPPGDAHLAPADGRQDLGEVAVPVGSEDALLAGRPD